MTTVELDVMIATAAAAHGAKAVSDAAYDAMSGDVVGLAAVGLGDAAGNLAALHRITVRAYDRMTEGEQAQDLMQAAIGAARLP